MNIYAKETSAGLLKLLQRLILDKEEMLSIGYVDIAIQNQRIIDSIQSELRLRNYETKEKTNETN